MSIYNTFSYYLSGSHSKVNYKTFYNYAKNNDANAIIGALFSLINNEIEYMSPEKNIDRLVELMNYLNLLIIIKDSIDKNGLLVRLKELQQKMIIIEQKFKYKQIIIRKFNRIRRKIKEITKILNKKQKNQGDFINCLAFDVKDLDCMKLVFFMNSSIVNMKDSNGISLFRAVLKEYLASIKNNNGKDICYYKNLIRIMVYSDQFKLTEAEKSECQKVLKSFLNKSRKFLDENTINALNNLKMLIEAEKDKNITNYINSFNFNFGFNPRIIEAAKLAKMPKEGKITDRKIVNGYTISIDPEDTRLVDDCLTCRRLENGNYELIVSVASVLSYFPYEEEIVQEAIKRSQTIWLSAPFLVENNIISKRNPIFPDEFAMQKGSLTEGRRNFARSYIFEIDPNGNIVSEEFVRSIVTNNKKLSFKEANEILERGTNNKELEETLRNLQGLAKIIEAKYNQSDCCEDANCSSRNCSGSKVNDWDSRSIVYQMTIFTGKRVGEWFAKNGYPCIYRVSNKDDDSNDNENEIHNNHDENKSARYSFGGKHDGLGIEHFVQCTSPLRRSSDILAEYCLMTCYDKMPSPEEIIKLQTELSEKIELINCRQEFINDFYKRLRKVRRPYEIL